MVATLRRELCISDDQHYLFLNRLETDTSVARMKCVRRPLPRPPREFQTLRTGVTRAPPTPRLSPGRQWVTARPLRRE